MVLGEGFRLDDKLGIWIRDSHKEFGYSDGDGAERNILEALRETDDRSIFSEPLRGKISSWPTLYHFSPRRHALLRHLKITPDTSLLELGAGCGAITRYLGECGARVWAVEGSRSRAACTAARTRGLDNVQVICADFQSLKPEETFDIVTLIGVLEYAPVFFKGDDPLLQCLKLARSFLKPTGSLVLAIENQLGLKYFCGAPEDHTGRPFDGIEDLYQSAGPRTHGRRDLNRLLTSAGFTDIQFQYPFPDYKMPGWILTQRAFETESFDPCAILRTIEPQHDGKPSALAADERKIWPVLHDQGLLPDLANSFLVLAGSGNIAQISPPSLLAAGYVLERRPCFNIQTQIHIRDNAHITVEKTPLTSAPAPQSPLRHLPGIEEYRVGAQLEQQIVHSLQRGSLESAVAGLSQWIKFVADSGLIEQNRADLYESRLKPEFFDCNPRNLIVVGDRMEHVDLEWRYAGELPLRFHVLRYLRIFTTCEKKLLRRCLPEKTNSVVELCRLIGMPVSKKQYDDYKSWQHQLNQWIVGEKRPPKRPLWRRMLART